MQSTEAYTKIIDDLYVKQQQVTKLCESAKKFTITVPV